MFKPRLRTNAARRAKMKPVLEPGLECVPVSVLLTEKVELFTVELFIAFTLGKFRTMATRVVQAVSVMIQLDYISVDPYNCGIIM
jgi:hypothetical protein